MWLGREDAEAADKQRQIRDIVPGAGQSGPLEVHLQPRAELQIQSDAYVQLANWGVTV